MFRIFILIFIHFSVSETGHAGIVEASAYMAKPAYVQTYKEIRRTFGTVPQFLTRFPPETISDVWNDYKRVWITNRGHLSRKNKLLLSISLSAQIPCKYCVYFFSSSAKALEDVSTDQVNIALAAANKKDLVAYLSAARAGCKVCLKLYSKAVLKQEISDKELFEATSIIAEVEQWATYFAETSPNEVHFKKEVDEFFSHQKKLKIHRQR